MSHAFRNLTLLALTALPGFGAMRIDQILNNYNPSTGPGLPNYAIAQGSIAIVKGLELSDRSTGLQSTYPLPRQLEGVGVEITVGGTTLSCILYYVLPQQIAFIVPSNTPIGTGVLRISNNGRLGTSPITVTKTGVGILTLNGAGTGPAAAFFAGTANLIRNNAASNPDDVVTLFGSGVGPFTGDESILNTAAQDYTSIETKVLVGSVPAEVLYRGASQFPGLNQINFKVPATGVGFGCYVSLLVITNGVPSNQTTIPVQAKGSRTCSDPPALTLLSNALLDAVAARGGVVIGSVSVGRSRFTLQFSVTTGDTADARYQKFDLTNFNLNFPPAAASYGSCSVFVSPKVDTPVPLPGLSFTPLDAGPALTLTGNGNSAPVPRNGPGYFASQNGLPTNILGNSSSTVTITAPGGPDVGAHTVSSDVPIGFVWSNEAAVASSPVDRSKGVTVTWTNAPANSFVQIGGGSGNLSGSVSFICNADPRAGTFTVPPDVLMQLPASDPKSGVGSGLRVVSAIQKFFTAEKLDHGIVSGFVNYFRSVTFP